MRVEQYPRLSASCLTPLSPPLEAAACGAEQGAQHKSITEFDSFEALAFGGERGGSTAARELYCHRLVQTDARGREYAVVHAVCLDHLEEADGEGGWRALSWADSQSFLEELLAPAARPPHVQMIDWRPGDFVIFDNLATQHSVTPTNAYTASGHRRLMTRTALQPMVDPLS